MPELLAECFVLIVRAHPDVKQCPFGRGRGRLRGGSGTDPGRGGDPPICKAPRRCQPLPRAPTPSKFMTETKCFQAGIFSGSINCSITVTIIACCRSAEEEETTVSVEAGSIYPLEKEMNLNQKAPSVWAHLSLGRLWSSQKRFPIQMLFCVDDLSKRRDVFMEAGEHQRFHLMQLSSSHGPGLCPPCPAPGAGGTPVAWGSFLLVALEHSSAPVLLPSSPRTGLPVLRCWVLRGGNVFQFLVCETSFAPAFVSS